MFDYLTSPSITVVNQVTALLETMYEEIEMSNTLCCEAGNEITIVYKFKGDVKAVLSQLRTYIELLRETKELTDSLRRELLHKATLHGEVIYDDPSTQLARLQHRRNEISFDEYMIIIEKAEITRKRWHELKQCRCYCN